MTGTSGLGTATAGVWTRAEALRHLSAGRIDALVRSRTWHTPWPGVCADGGCSLDPVQRAWAAVLASGGDVAVLPDPAVLPHAAGRPDAAVLPDAACRPAPATRGGVAPRAAGGPVTARVVAFACGRTAARVWQFPLIDDDDPATGARENRHDDVGAFRNRGGDLHWQERTLHRHQLRLSAGDLHLLPSGLWITSPLRTLVDCASLLTLEALVCCLDDALHRSVVTQNQLTEAVHARKGRRGGPALRDAVAMADGRAEAPSESLLRLLLRPQFPRLEPQLRLCDHAARVVARFDLGDRDARVAVEADGVGGHQGSDMVAKDRRRDRGSRRLGWLTERVTWFDIRRRRGEVVERVGETYAEQRRRS